MAAGLKTKRETMADQIDVLQQEVERAARLTEAGRELCRRMAAGHRPTVDERRIFELLRWSDNDIDRETGRWAAVSEWQAKAGTAESRAAAEAALATAQAADAKHGAEMDAKIAELTRQRNELSKAVAAAQAAVDGNKSACEALRGLSPNQTEVARRRGDVRQRFHAEISDLEERTRVGRAVPLLDEEGRLLHARSAERQGVSLIDRKATSMGIKEEVNLQKWAAYLAERQAELPELEARLAELLAQRAAEMAEVERALDDLIPQ